MALKTLWIWIVFVLLPAHVVVGQNCLELLDSAQAYQSKSPVKSAAFLHTLVQVLDSRSCESDQIGYAEVYNNVALIYVNIGDKMSGLKIFKKAVTEELKDHDSLSIELLPFYENLFSFYRKNRRYDSAALYLSVEGRVLANNHWKTESQVAHLVKSGVFYKEMGYLNQSFDQLSKAQKLSERPSVSDSLKGSVLIEMGTLLTLLGNHEQANENLTRAISILRNGHPYLHAKAVDRLAKLMMEGGHLSQSEGSLLGNISFKKSTFPSDTLLLVESLNNLGALYYRINDIVKAGEYFSEIVRIGNSYPEIKPYGLNNLGAVYLNKGDIIEAEKCFQEATDYFSNEFGSQHPDYANALSNLAAAKYQHGLHEEALSLYTQVLELDRSLFGKNHPKLATSMTNLAHVYAQMGYLEIALSLSEQSTRIKENSYGKHHHLLAKSYDDLGLMQLAHRDTTAALQSFDSALNINILHIKKILPVLTEKQRVLAFDHIRDNLRRFSSLAFSGQYFETVWAERAMNYMINTKGILFYASGKMHGQISNTEDAVVKGLFNLWKRTAHSLANAYLLTTEEREVQGISLETLEKEHYSVEKRLAQRISNFHISIDPKPVNWQDIASKLDPGSSLVEIIEFAPYRLKIDSAGITQGFINQQSTYVAFVISSDGTLQRHRWSKSTDFAREFRFYQNSLRYNVPNYRSYDVLWKPVDNLLTGFDKVYFAGDGEWHKINPRVFYDHTESKYVLEKYHMINVTSGIDLASFEERTTLKNAFFIGNPNFSAHTKENLAPLPGAELEAYITAQMVRKSGWKAQSIIQNEASERTIKIMDNPGILHIATHGFFNEDFENPLTNSGLYLTKSLNNEDGKLTAYEAMNLKLDQTLLVVLSACETGLGTIHNGEGVYGLQRAFLVAGAQNLIISLYKINDQVTLDFMALFYQNFLETGDIQQSFFDTQSSFRTYRSNPLDWGAFVLIARH